MPTKKTTAKKPATKKATTPSVFARIQELIKKITTLDEEQEDYVYEGLRLRVDEQGAQLEDDYNGTWGKKYNTLEEVEAVLVKTFDELEKEVGKVVKALTNRGQAARVNENGIEVGCEKVTFEKFDELAKVVAEVRPTKAQLAAKKKATTTKKTKPATSSNDYIF